MDFGSGQPHTARHCGSAIAASYRRDRAELFFPHARGSLQCPGGIAFAISFVGIDYLYYWNHRWLHQVKLWPFHRVHHSSKSLDLFATSRNSLWTIFLIVYLWSQAAFLFFLQDPWPFALGVALSSTLDIWRHSGFTTPNMIRKLLGAFLILPEDHEWHHSQEISGVNYGANLNIWDQLHGTFYRPNVRAQALGEDLGGSLWAWFWAPWRMSK